MISSLKILGCYGFLMPPTNITHRELFRQLKHEVRERLNSPEPSNPFLNAVTYLKRSSQPSKLEQIVDNLHLK